eukprot:Clim_evm81s156 gene=Clim_evmTU81s156
MIRQLVRAGTVRAVLNASTRRAAVGSAVPTGMILVRRQFHQRRQRSSVSDAAVSSFESDSDEGSRVSLSRDGRTVSVSFNEGSRPSQDYSVQWLRHNCQCDVCMLQSSGQRNVLILDFPEKLSIRSAGLEHGDGPERLVVDWEDGHRSEFTGAWLRRFGYDHSHPDSADSLRSWRWARSMRRLWKGEDQPDFARVDHDAFMGDDHTLLQALKRLARDGIVYITNTPAEYESVSRMGERVGALRTTFYGTTWDVVSKPQAENVAYTAQYLGPHMDLMYFESPPGVQYLHALKYKVKGGANIFVDAFKLTKDLKEQDPEAFHMLATYPMTFHYNHDGHRRRYERPIFHMGNTNRFDDGLPSKIYYAPPFEGPLRLPASIMDDYYAAYRQFVAMVEDPAYHYEHLLGEGETVIFDNRRVMHARRDFDAAEGHRHLRGTYVDYDDFYNRLQWLTDKFEDGQQL